MSGARPAPPRPWGMVGAWMRPFDELEVGETYVSRRRTITETDLVRFGALTGGLDLLPLAYSIGLVPNDHIRALRRILDLRWLGPVGRGETIHVAAEIVRLEPWTEDYGLASGAWRIVKQDGGVAMTVELEAVWRRRRA